MDSLFYEQIEQLLSPIIVFVILGFFVLVGILVITLINFSDKLQHKENSETQFVKKDFFEKELEKINADLRKKLDYMQYLSTNVRNSYKFEDVYNRLNDFESDINKILKKVGKKNGSKN